MAVFHNKGAANAFLAFFQFFSIGKILSGKESYAGGKLEDGNYFSFDCFSVNCDGNGFTDSSDTGERPGTVLVHIGQGKYSNGVLGNDFHDIEGLIFFTEDLFAQVFFGKSVIFDEEGITVAAAVVGTDIGSVHIPGGGIVGASVEMEGFVILFPDEVNGFKVELMICQMLLKS